MVQDHIEIGKAGFAKNRSFELSICGSGLLRYDRMRIQQSININRAT